jgi:hypothetical protein
MVLITFSQFVEQLKELGIPAKLLLFFSSTAKEGLNYLNSLNQSGEFCSPIQTFKKTRLGSGAQNIAYNIDGNKDYILRESKATLKKEDFLILGHYKKYINTENDPVLYEYIFTDKIYDTLIQSIISVNYPNNQNFNSYIGSFICSSDDGAMKLYSVIEKNDIDVLSFLQTNYTRLTTEILFSFVLQFAFISRDLYNIGVVDFDRHLANVMIKNRQTMPTGIIYQNNNKQIILDDLTTARIVPVDFGISCFVDKNTGNIIRNADSEYNVSHQTCSNSPFALENIKAKYILENREFHPNTMFFFFLLNLYKVLSILDKKDEVEDVKKFLKLLLKCFNNTVCNLNIIEEYMRYDSLPTMLFYLYRNIGVSGVSMETIIDHITQFIISKQESGEIKQLIKINQ